MQNMAIQTKRGSKLQVSSLCVRQTLCIRPHIALDLLEDFSDDLAVYGLSRLPSSEKPFNLSCSLDSSI